LIPRNNVRTLEYTTITGLKGRTADLKPRNNVRTLEYTTITGLKGRTVDLKPRNSNWLAGLESERSKVWKVFNWFLILVS
jgi:hypothetical protein